MSTPDPYPEIIRRETGSGNADEVSIFQTLRVYLPLFLKHWWVLIPFVIGAFSYSYYNLQNETVQYRSQARLKVQGRVNLPNSSNVWLEEYQHFFATNVALMTTPEIRMRARKRVESLYPEYINNHPSTEYSAAHQQQTTLFILETRGPNREYTQRFLDACIEEFLRYKAEERSESVEVTVAKVKEEIHHTEEDLRTIENELLQFQSRYNIVFIREQYNSAANYLVSLNKALADYEKQYNLILLFSQHLESLTAENLSQEERDLLSGVGESSAYVQARQRLSLLQAEMARLGKYLRPKHPKMQRLASEIQQQLLVLNEFRKQNEQELLNRKRSVELNMQNTSEQIAAWELRSVELSRRQAEYDEIISRRDSAKARLEQHREQLRRIDLSQRLDTETISLFERASEASKIPPQSRKQLLTSSMVGLLLGMGVVFILIKWNEKIYNPIDLPEFGDIPVSSYIPKVSARGRVELLKENDQRFSFIESFRSLRSFLMLYVNQQKIPGHSPHRVMSVTSAIPGDGKSTISTNLAISLAMAGSRTLLVDADMRKGSLHDAFKVSAEPGLVQILRAEESWWETIIQTHYPNLHFLPRGEVAMSSAELLLGPKCKEFFEEIIYHYDYIILDTPPVLATDDVANLISHVDSVLLVVRHGATSQKDVRNALELLHNRHARILGYVMNACEGSGAGYYRYQYYGRYGADMKKG